MVEELPDVICVFVSPDGGQLYPRGVMSPASRPPPRRSRGRPDQDSDGGAS